MREEILQQASELFLTLGFKSVTMDDLAQDAGISKKTIYSHFENKTKLVEETAMHMFWQISDGIDAITKQQKNPIEELYEIKRFVMEHLKGEKASPIYQLQKYYPKIHAALRAKQYEVMLDCTLDNVKRGVALGIYRENLNVEFIARIYFEGVNSIKDEKVFPRALFSQGELFDYYLEYHLRGIVTPKGRKQLNGIINSNQE